MASPMGKVSSQAVTEAAAIVRRQELFAKILSSLAGLAISGVVSYFGVKWLVNTLDPTHKEKEASKKRADALLKKIGVHGIELTEYELCVASNLIDPLSMVISWNDIGGLQSVIKEIQESVILPFKQPQIFASSSLLQPPKGVLLYGPPGCGKTMIAKATAKAAGARFINLQLSSLFDKWYGESQKRAEAVFSLATKIQPCIIFIDEIDSFLRSRSGSDHESTAMMKTQFMSWWDGVATDPKSHILIMAATNRPQDVDAAILRRMPATFKIDYPDRVQREQILRLILSPEQVSPDVDQTQLAARTQGLSGSDLKELCRLAALGTVRDFLSDGGADGTDGADGAEFHAASAEPQSILREISVADFEDALARFQRCKLGRGLQSDIPLG